MSNSLSDYKDNSLSKNIDYIFPQYSICITETIKRFYRCWNYYFPMFKIETNRLWINFCIIQSFSFDYRKCTGYGFAIFFNSSLLFLFQILLVLIQEMKFPSLFNIVGSNITYVALFLSGFALCLKTDWFMFIC